MEELYNNIIEKKNLWNYYNKELDKPDLRNSSSCFKYLESKSSKQFINKEFTYLWFMLCLYHDLGYNYEKEESNATDCFFNSLEEVNMGIPSLYKEIYMKYFKYRNGKDHGILGGIYFYRDMCDIRKFQYHKARVEVNYIWEKS